MVCKGMKDELIISVYLFDLWDFNIVELPL